MNGPVQFILNCGKNALRDLSRQIIANQCCVDIGYLLVKLAFAKAYLS